MYCVSFLLSLFCQCEFSRRYFVVVYVVRQGSILDPILLKTFLCNMFFLAGSVDITNYASDNTPNTIEKTNIKLNKIRNSVVSTFLMLP